MPRINPHVGLFVALAALMVALFGWQRSDMNAMEARLVAGQNALAERVAQVEAGQNALAERVARIEAGLNALVGRVTQIGAGQDKLVERVARIEGRIEGVLAFARGTAFADPAPRDSVPSR